jgi:hypothetical protein
LYGCGLLSFKIIFIINGGVHRSKALANYSAEEWAKTDIQRQDWLFRVLAAFVLLSKLSNNLVSSTEESEHKSNMQNLEAEVYVNAQPGCPISLNKRQRT